MKSLIEAVEALKCGEDYVAYWQGGFDDAKQRILALIRQSEEEPVDDDPGGWHAREEQLDEIYKRFSTPQPAPQGNAEVVDEETLEETAFAEFLRHGELPLREAIRHGLRAALSAMQQPVSPLCGEERERVVEQAFREGFVCGSITEEYPNDPSEEEVQSAWDCSEAKAALTELERHYVLVKKGGGV